MRHNSVLLVLHKRHEYQAHAASNDLEAGRACASKELECFGWVFEMGIRTTGLRTELFVCFFNLLCPIGHTEHARPQVTRE